MKWTSFKKKRPNKKKNKEVITFEYLRHIKNGKMIPCACIENTDSIHYRKGFIWTDAGGSNLTHWMPLPEPPNEVD